MNKLIIKLQKYKNQFFFFFFYKCIQYSYKNAFVDSLRILKTLRQQWTPARRY